MKAIIVDTPNHEIYEQDIDDNDLKRYLSFGHYYSSGFDMVYLTLTEAMFVDDEGLVRNLPLFELKGHEGLLAGKAVILGMNEEGESVDTTLSVERVVDAVTWRDDVEYSHSETSIRKTPDMFTLTSTPVFRKKKELT